MTSKIDFLYTNQIWTLNDPPEGIKLIGCKWIYKRKTNMDCNVQIYKIKLDAKLIC
jgi:hypothetical protein